MRGGYEASIQILTLAAARTLIYITAPANQVVEILEAEITNLDNETNEQLEAVLQRVTTLGTPTATTLTPSKDEPGDQAAVSTVKGNVTASEPTYTSNTEHGRKGFGSLSGWLYEPVSREARPIIPGGATLGLRLLTTTFTSVGLVARVKFREIG